LDGVSRVLLATDNDEPGQALAEELARRLGRERCWRVRWPQGSDSALLADGTRPEGYLKDANEVLLNAGADALRECVANAEPYPIRGLFRCCRCTASLAVFVAMISGLTMVRGGCGDQSMSPLRFSDFYDDIMKSYASDEQESGSSTGWRELDKYYRVGLPVMCRPVCRDAWQPELS
jgi:twinkle protein